MGSALAVLWPIKKNSEPTLLGRLGRVLHWSLTAFAIMVGLLGISHLHSASIIDVSAPAPEGWESAQAIVDWYSEQGTKWVFMAIGAFIVGRIARYVLSAE